MTPINAQRQAKHEWVCPQCGDDTDELVEGYCSFCYEVNQLALDEHNAGYDAWQELSDAERWDYIKDAAIKL